MLTILIIVLIVLALGGGTYGARQGFYTQGSYNGLGLLPVLLIILALFLFFDRGALTGL